MKSKPGKALKGTEDKKIIEGWKNLKRRTASKTVPGTTWQTRFVKMSKKKPKKPTQTKRARFKEALKKAGLARTKMQRRDAREAFKRLFGYEQARLSRQVGKPSRYAVKRRIPLTKTETYTERGEPKTYTNIWGEQHTHVPERQVTVKRTVGERLVVKRLGKRGAKKKGGGARGKGPESEILGSAAAIRVSVKAAKHTKEGKRGARTGREKRKEKSKKKKKKR